MGRGREWVGRTGREGGWLRGWGGGGGGGVGSINHEVYHSMH